MTLGRRPCCFVCLLREARFLRFLADRFRTVHQLAYLVSRSDQAIRRHISDQTVPHHWPIAAANKVSTVQTLSAFCEGWIVSRDSCSACMRVNVPNMHAPVKCLLHDASHSLGTVGQQDPCSFRLYDSSGAETGMRTCDEKKLSMGCWHLQLPELRKDRAKIFWRQGREQSTVMRRENIWGRMLPGVTRISSVCRTSWV